SVPPSQRPMSVCNVCRSKSGAIILLVRPSMETGANSRSGTLPLALGTGLPVVVVRRSETDPELFRDGENVVFATELSGPAFADAILRLMDDPAARQRIGAAARRVYEQEMSWPR